MAKFFHSYFTPVGEKIESSVHDFNDVAADQINKPLIDWFTQTFARKQVDTQHPILDRPDWYRFSFMMFGRSTAGCNFYYGDDAPGCHWALTMLLSGRKIDADDALIHSFQKLMNVIARPRGIEPAIDLLKSKERPLCATVPLILPPQSGVVDDQSADDFGFVMDFQLPLAAAFFRAKGII
jgi:hypothetical protein